jgi:PEP-CTERM putative exosortase interaction domain
VGLNEEGFIPDDIATGDIYFSFYAPGTNEASVTDFVEFSIGDQGGDLDIFDISFFDNSGNLLNTFHYEDTSHFLVSYSTPNIHSVAIDFTGEYGYSLDDLSFNTPASSTVSSPVSNPSPVSAVPEPGAAILVALGMMVMMGIVRKNQIYFNFTM